MLRPAQTSRGPGVLAWATVVGLRSTGAADFLALRLTALGLGTVELERVGEGRCGGVSCVVDDGVEAGDGSLLIEAATRSVGTFSTAVDSGAATAAWTGVADGAGDGVYGAAVGAAAGAVAGAALGDG